MPARAPSKRRWASQLWSLCWCCAWPVSALCRCRCVVSMPPAKLPGWPRAATSGRQSSSPGASHRAGRRCSFAATARSLLPPSVCGRSCCLRWSSWRPGFRRPRLVDELGSATVVAAAMVAVLLAVTGGGAALGSVVVARHRAQAAADLAALAAASELPAGTATACSWATRLARRMRADNAECAVDGLDVVVTVRMSVPLAGRFTARATARAGPA